MKRYDVEVRRLVDGLEIVRPYAGLTDAEVRKIKTLEECEPGRIVTFRVTEQGD